MTNDDIIELIAQLRAMARCEHEDMTVVCDAVAAMETMRSDVARLRARVEVMTSLLGYFTGRNDDHIQVMLAGNPDAIEDLISRVDAAMKETAP